MRGISFVNFCDLSMPPGDLASNFVTFVKFPFFQETFLDLQSSVSCQCGRDTFCQLISTLVAARKLSVNFCRSFVRQEDLPSTSVNFPCGRQVFHHLLSTSDNFLCSQQTFRHRLVQPVELIFVKFLCSRKILLQLSVNFKF